MTQDELLGRIKRYRFPQTFEEGRTWFRAAAHHAGGDLESAVNPNGKGPRGEELTTDMAWFGRADAPRVFLAISGTHGQEYFCGAAIQMQWIVGGGPERLPEGVAVCLVHAHNPHGAAHLSRANEHFVDLNRNYFEEASPSRPNPLYPELFDLLFTDKIDLHVMDDVMSRYDHFVETHDLRDVLTAMGGGQTTHPTGNIYCGIKPEWSTENLRSIVRRRLAHAQKVAVIDWHTGLGVFGSATMLNEPTGDEQADRWIGQWWGGTRAADELQGGTKALFVGRVAQGVADELRGRGATVAATVVELGTFENRGILASLLIDRWLRIVCTDQDDPHAVELRTRMMERLNPSLPEWRDAVLARGSEIYQKTLAGLAAWT